jgi:hypothetical protein
MGGRTLPRIFDDEADARAFVVRATADADTEWRELAV